MDVSWEEYQVQKTTPNQTKTNLPFKRDSLHTFDFGIAQDIYYVGVTVTI